VICPAHRRHRIQTEGQRFRVTTEAGQSFLVWAQDEADAFEEGAYRLLITYDRDGRILRADEVLPGSNSF
jgi:hypothetical protein